MVLRTRFLLSWLLFMTAGCGPGGPEIAYVSGRVTMDGQPLANASVIFIPENGRPAGARTDADGNYVLNFDESRRGAIPGKNSVRITTLREAEQDENGKTVTPAQNEKVPPQFNTNSQLSFEVVPRKRNVANFELTSKGVPPARP
jgi:hypothetical protein